MPQTLVAFSPKGFLVLRSLLSKPHLRRPEGAELLARPVHIVPPAPAALGVVEFLGPEETPETPSSVHNCQSNIHREGSGSDAKTLGTLTVASLLVSLNHLSVSHVRKDVAGNQTC